MSDPKVAYSPLHSSRPSFDASTNTTPSAAYPNIQPSSSADYEGQIPPKSPEHKRYEHVSTSFPHAARLSDPKQAPANNNGQASSPSSGAPGGVPSGVIRQLSAANEYIKARVPAPKRLKIFWVFGGLLAFIWTIAIFAHANSLTSWCNPRYSHDCDWYDTAGETLGFVVSSFVLIGFVVGFVVAYKYINRSARDWCRCREKPSAAGVNGGVNDDTPLPTTQPNMNSTAGNNEPMLTSPRGSQSTGSCCSSFIVAIIPFSFISAILGTWFGFQIGGVVGILSYGRTMDRWAFSFCEFAMLFTGPLVAVLSMTDRLVPALNKIDPVLSEWCSNQGLAPLGRFVYAFYRGAAVSGWAALIGVLIGTCVGLPAALFGGVGMAIIIAAAVIGVIAYFIYKKRHPSQPQIEGAPNGSNPMNGAELQNVVIATPSAPTAVPQPQATVAKFSSSSPVHSGAIEVQGGNHEGEVIYLRGLALLNGSPHHAKDPQQGAQLIMQSAHMGYQPAQEHLRLLLIANGNEAIQPTAPYQQHH